jgi:hypothetical protein
MNERAEKILLYCVLPLLVLVGAWILFLGPRYDRYQSAVTARDNARKSEQRYRQPYKVSDKEQASLEAAFPSAPDVDGTRRWIEERARMADGTVTDFRPAQGNAYDVRLTVPRERAAGLISDLLHGMNRHELLPIAQAPAGARLIRIQRISLVKSQGGTSSVQARILLPTPL